MKINVIFFGVLAEVAQTTFNCYNDIQSFDDFESRLKEDLPELDHYNYRIALNNVMINEKPILRDGDEIAVIPLFEGG